MKELVLEVEPRKYKFLLDLVKSFDFVTIRKQTSNKELIISVAKGMQQAKSAAAGKIKSRSAKAFLNEI